MLTDLQDFMRGRKKCDRVSMLIVMVLPGSLLIFAAGSAVTSFIDTLYCDRGHRDGWQQDD